MDFLHEIARAGRSPARPFITAHGLLVNTTPLFYPPVIYAPFGRVLRCLYYCAGLAAVTDQRMQRVTSAEALSSSAGQANTTNPTPIHGLLPHVSELYDGASETDDADDDAGDDVPLLQHNSQSNQPKHTFDVSASEIQHNEPHTSTAWREAVASLKLAAPVTVQVLSELPRGGSCCRESSHAMSKMQAISQFGHILVIMSAVGHIGVDELAAVAVGWTVYASLA